MSAALTEQAADLAIDGACRELHLPTVRAQHGEFADAAVRDGVSHRAFLAEVLAAEVEERDARRRQRRIAEARFPRFKRLDDFDLSAAPTIPPASLAALAGLAWLTNGEPLVLLGDPGTGKSHCETDDPAQSRATAQTGAGSGGHDPKVSLVSRGARRAGPE
jgi:DNA replication protein DnaC